MEGLSSLSYEHKSMLVFILYLKELIMVII